MDWIAFDWREVFVSTVSPVEIFLRGTCVYLGIFSLMRILLRRVAGSVTIADLLMVVLISDASQNAMTADYHSLTDGFVLISTIIFWNYALDRLAFHFPLIGRFVYPNPLPLVRNGRVLWRNLRREYISEEELRSQMREQGVEAFEEIKLAQMEGDGRISIIKRR